MSTFFYCIGQGFSNLRKKGMFSAASIATVAACVFICSTFFVVFTNIRTMVHRVEANVGITVFFEDGITDTERESIKEGISRKDGVSMIRYISAEEAWAGFKDKYFGDRGAELEEAFEGENPLEGSDSFIVYMDDIEMQPGMAVFIKGMKGVREVNYASAVVGGLKKANTVITALFAVITGILLAVSIFLISNTITVAAEFRRRENEIMRLIGATSFMIRAPFIVEGVLIGVFGSLISTAGICLLYRKAAAAFEAQLLSSSSMEGMADLFRMLPLQELLPGILLCGLVLGVGIGFLVSATTIRRHLRV